MKPSALVLLSGGQDSATCLIHVVKTLGLPAHALTLNYGQRHAVEMECAKKLAARFAASHTILDIPNILPKSAMNDTGIAVAETGGYTPELPTTFLPGRNMVFLAIACSRAAALGIPFVVTGVCETDYSGYPDCRQEFITSMEYTVHLALGNAAGAPGIITPLMRLTKAGTFDLAHKAGELDTIINETHTCYMGDHTHLHTWGYGCGECPACNLRKRGFELFQASQA